MSGAALFAFAAGCAEPSGSYGDYRDKVAQTAKQMVSVINTADYTARILLRGDVTEPYADTVISNAEQDAASVQAALDTRQPPDARSVG